MGRVPRGQTVTPRRRGGKRASRNSQLGLNFGPGDCWLRCRPPLGLLRDRLYILGRQFVLQFYACGWVGLVHAASSVVLGCRPTRVVHPFGRCCPTASALTVDPQSSWVNLLCQISRACIPFVYSDQRRSALGACSVWSLHRPCRTPRASVLQPQPRVWLHEAEQLLGKSVTSGSGA